MKTHFASFVMIYDQHLFIEAFLILGGVGDWNMIGNTTFNLFQCDIYLSPFAYFIWLIHIHAKIKYII